MRWSHQSYLIPWLTGCEWHCFIPLPGSLIYHVSSHHQQLVSDHDIALFLCQTVLSIMSHPMTNRMWVTLLYFFAWQSHQSCLIPWPTGCEWLCFTPLPGNLTNHDQQLVSNIQVALFLCQTVSSLITHPMNHRKWVTWLHFFSRHLINHVSSYDQQIVSDTAVFLCLCQAVSCLILWSTVCEWCCFIPSLPGSVINHVSSHHQQLVSDTTLFLCQAVSSIISHPMTNREWVTQASHWSCLIPSPTGSEWHCFISLPGSLINHVSSHNQQLVSDIALFLCQTVSSIMFHPMANSKWVTLLYFFARQSHQSCLIPSPTGCEWHCFISLPGSLSNHVALSHDQ